MKRWHLFLALFLVIAINVFAAVIEPCDGHSCDRQAVTR